MGREIRRVPANWEHPKYTQDDAMYSNQVGQYKSLFKDYDKALAEFAADIAKMGLSEAIEYHGGGPLKSSYVDYEGREATWWQVYETVSEGSPVTPPFATPEELIERLVANGDDWDERRGNGGWSRKSAERFVKDEGWAPSMVGIAGVGLITGVEALGRGEV